MSPSSASTADVPTCGTTSNGATAGKKKSILKKSDSNSHHSSISSSSHVSHHPISALRSATSGKAAAGDPELENLLVSDAEGGHSANTTPAPVRKPMSIVNLPPTAKNEQLKSLTGPKLRMGTKSTPPNKVSSSETVRQRPILVNSNKSAVNNNKNNGNVASKEIQTSTANLLALAATASTNNNVNNSDTNNSKKFERGREPNTTTDNLNQTKNNATEILNVASDGLGNPPVFRCPNDMCRHNKASTTLTTSKKKICLCGRTMINQNNSLLRHPTSSIGGPVNDSTVVESGGVGDREATDGTPPPDLLTSSTHERISS